MKKKSMKKKPVKARAPKAKAVKKVMKKKAKASKSKLSVLNLKVNARDRQALSAQAKKFAKGSLSAWLRHAGQKYVPKKGETVSVKAYK